MKPVGATQTTLTIPNVGGNVVLLTQLYWPLVHPALQEPRPTR